MAAKRPPLRSVAPNEKRTPAKKRTVSEAASEGSLKDELIAMRDRIAKAVDDPTCSPRDLAPLCRQLIGIGKELEAIAVAEAEEAGGATETPDEDWSAI